MRSGSWVGAWLLMVLSLGVAPTLPAQSLDEIERQIEAAKREQAAKAAAEKREAEARAAREAQAAAAEARLGTLVVQSDHGCRLSIDGMYHQDIGPGEIASLKVEPGDQLIECVSTKFEDLKVQEIKQLVSGGKSVVVLAFGERAARAEAAELAARQLREREEARARRFRQDADGIHDAEQGVIWAASDNGSDIDWHGARSYCSGKGQGWRLPTVAQLLSLYDGAGENLRSVATSWGTYAIKPATGLFELSGPFYWSSESSGASGAFRVFFDDGQKGSTSLITSSNLRALCVRLP